MNCPRCQVGKSEHGEWCEACRLNTQADRVNLSRSGKHSAPRLSVQLPVNQREVSIWRKAAEAEGVPLAQWLVEAARAWVVARE